MTPWHRAWQAHCERPGWLTEMAVQDASGELHIADAVSAGGQVIEFQHSQIDPVEVSLRNRAHHPLVWMIDATTAPTRMSAAPDAGTLSWDAVPGWVLALSQSSRWVVADLGDRSVRLKNPVIAASVCRFDAVTLSATRIGDSGDEYRARLLDVFDLFVEHWDQGEFLEWALNDDCETTGYLVGKGTTPTHAVIWIRGSGSVDDLVEVHQRADAVGWVLPADVFETHHGSWLSARARRHLAYQSVEHWFERSYARKVVDDAGIPAGPAAEWCNMGRQPEMLIEAQRELRALGSGLDVVWRQHKSGADAAWQELKTISTRATREGLAPTARNGLVREWVTKWIIVPPYR